MAYGAYQLAQPRQSLLSSMVQRGFGSSVDPSIKKKGIMDEFQEKLKRKSKSAEKRSKKWQPVTTALDIAAGFVPPPIAAALGAVSGGLSGYDRMRAYEGLEDFGKQYEGMSFMDEYLKDTQKQIGGLETDLGDVLVSAGTGALKNFAMGKASEAMAGLKGAKGTKGVDPIDKALGVTADSSQFATDALTGETINVVTGETAGKAVGTNIEGQIIDKSGQVVPDTLTGLDKTGLSELKQTNLAQTKTTPKFKPEGADWIKKLQEGGGKDMLAEMFKEDPMGALAQLTQMGQGFLEPLMNQKKRSDFRLY